MKISPYGNNINHMGKRKGGRPEKYNPEFSPILAEALARCGHIDKEIAVHMGITEATLNNWKNKYPEFLESLKKGKLGTDQLVENALLKRALGFYAVETKVFHYQGKIITKDVRVYYPPDVAACIFWLRNRMADKWKQNPDTGDSDEAMDAIRKIARNIMGSNDS